MFDYNYDKLTKLWNSPNVLYLKTCSVDKKRALCAVIKIDDGVYEKVIVTKPQSILTYPFNPITEFFNFIGPNYMLSNDFIPLMYNYIAVNKEYLNWIEYCEDNSNKNNVVVFARFKDGSCTILDILNKNKFEKNGIKEYRKILEQNKVNREVLPENIGNPIIEFFMKDNIATIPVLKNQKTYVKKLD